MQRKQKDILARDVFKLSQENTSREISPKEDYIFFEEGWNATKNAERIPLSKKDKKYLGKSKRKT